MHIDGTVSNSYNAVTYTGINQTYTPVSINSSGVFSYGSWKDNEFFIPRPCMLKFDGTVDYYLNPNNYKQKEDGTPSDVANINYAGNAMMEWGRGNGERIWLKCVPDSSNDRKADIYISNVQMDEDYHAFSFIGPDGVTMKDHFYTPIYIGSKDSNGRMRSISGASMFNYSSHDDEIAAVNKLITDSGVDGYNIETFGDRCLINLLTILITKTISPKSVFGAGRTGSSESYLAKNGECDEKGMFFAKKSTTAGVGQLKVFGMENLWGNVWRRGIGSGMSSRTNIFKYKMCYGTTDGSTKTEYDSKFGGFISTSWGFSGSSGNYCEVLRYTPAGAMIAISSTSNATSTTYYGFIYYCDANPAKDQSACFGSCLLDGDKSNVCSVLYTPLDRKEYYIAAALSYR